MKRRVSLKRLVIPGVCLLMAAGTLALGLTYRAGIPDMGLADARNIRDIPRGATAIEYAWGEKPEDEPWMEEKDFAMVDGEYEALQAPIVARVSSTGNMRLANGSTGQEFTVKEVLRGEEFLSEGQTSYFYQDYGFVKMVGCFRYGHTLNMMNPDHEYLIFLKESPLNAYSAEKAYLSYSLDFGYIRLGGGRTATLPEDYENMDFLDLQDYEFFSVSEKCTAVLNEIRGEILAEFGY